MTTYTLFELNEYIRRIMALNFSANIWVSCEIAQIGISKGHRYLNLIQKSEETGAMMAQMEGILWEQTYRRLRRKTGKSIEVILQEGMAVLVQVKVDFHERYGLKLLVEDIDPGYTMGQLALQRQQTLDQLHALQLLDRNATLPLKPVLQRIALITSERAAGFQDYQKQLQTNAYAYEYQNTLFPATVQGENAPKEIIRQVKNIQGKADRFDCIVIVRGGGAKLDLLAFDDLELCKTVANCSLPVITGIGHEVDESILDRVAHTSLKTPTAVAEFLIQRHLHFESALLQYGQELKRLADVAITTQQLQLQRLEQLIGLKSKNDLINAERMLEYIVHELPKSVQLNLKNQEKKLEQLSQICRLLSPEETLKRGFSITLQNGKVVKNAKTLKAGDRIKTLLHQGSLESEIKTSNP